MTSPLLCIVFAAAALICATGWYAEHRRRVTILQRYSEVQDLNDAILQRYRELTDAGLEATRVIIRLTEALQAKRGRAQSLPHRVRMYVN